MTRSIKDEQWLKFCQAKEDFDKCLDVAIANCLLEEVRSKDRMRKVYKVNITLVRYERGISIAL